jgi:membrane protein
VPRPLIAFWRKAYEDNLTGLAAMVAYNLLLSVFPFALIALFVAGRVLQSEDLQASVLADLKRIFPAAAETTLSEGVRRLQNTSPTVGIIALVASIWIGASFWGALDTAFCRIYQCECRTWVRQKLFALGMLGISLLFVVVTVAVPTVQAFLVAGTRELPLGLDEVRGLVYWITLVAGVIGLFVALCATYWWVPKEKMPWRCVWPGALGATVAMAIVDLGFPLYLDNISALRVGTSAVFVLIALVWFYALAMILLAGAVVNELRFERSLQGMPDPTTEGMRLDQIAREREEHARARAAEEPAEREAHAKRADKAAYLKAKLAERAEAEDRAAAEDARED